MRTMRMPTAVEELSHFGLQKAQQPMRKERRVTARFLQRIADPEMRRAGQHHRAGVVPRLLQRLQEGFGLRATVDDVVRRAPGDEERRGVPLRRDVRNWPSVEINAPGV